MNNYESSKNNCLIHDEIISKRYFNIKYKFEGKRMYKLYKFYC